MKRVALWSVAAFALIAWSPAPGGPSATGAGHFESSGGLRTFSFSAITKKDGSVTGQAQLSNRGLDSKLHVDIDCMVVSGNTATISGVITNSNVGLDGFTAYFTVVDNGEGGASPDEMSLLAPIDPASGLDCTVPLNMVLYPIDGGNVQVRQ
jgi:hypothetical protein